MTSIRQQLIEMYGRVEGYQYTNLPVALLDRKLSMCRQVMQILNTFNPGLSRSRALLLYELHLPLILSSRCRLLSKSIDDEKYKLAIHEAIAMLEECSVILQWEDLESFESVVNRSALVTLKQLRAEVGS